jgi:hypothetical protein
MAQDASVKKDRKNRRRALIPCEFRPRFWEDSDARLSVVKLIRKRYLAIKEDCGADSIQRDLLAQRAAFVSIILETQEIECAESGKLDLGSYIQACNSLSGLLIRLGLERKVKNVTDLRAYLDRKETATTNGNHRRHK